MPKIDTLKIEIKMPRVLPVLCLWLTLCGVLYSQDKFDPAVDLTGNWNVSAPRTEEQGEIKLPRGSFTHPLQMLPVARRLKFTDEQVTYLDSKVVKKFKVKSFDRDSGLLELQLEAKWDSVLRFEVLNKDTLALDCAVGIGGPIQVVYTRDGTRKAPNLLAQIDGNWVLDRAATSRLWQSSGTPTAIKNFGDFGNQALEDATTLTITKNVFEFSDESFEPWQAKIESGETTFMLLNQYNKANFEVQILSEDVIQFFDRDRFLFAVYKRNNKTVLPEKEFSAGKLARQTLQQFEDIKPRAGQHVRKANPRRSGNVSIQEIAISQNRSIARKNSRAKIDFGVRLPSKFVAARGRHIFQFKKRGEIVDDRGASLAAAISAKGGFSDRRSYTNGSQLNPDGSIDLTMAFNISSPSEGASKIMELSGTIEIFRIQRRSIRFGNVANFAGQPLAHPYLKDETIIAEIDERNPKQFNMKFSSKAKALIASWHLNDSSGKKLRSSSSGSGGGKIHKGFGNPIPRDASLVINVDKKIPVHEAPFQFKDVELP